MDQVSQISQLISQANLPSEKISGIMVLSQKDYAVIHSENVNDVTNKASMCLSLLSASTSLTQSFDDSPVKLLRVRTEPKEYFIVCGE